MLGDAAEEFKKAIAIDPRYPRAHYYLGMTYLLDEGQSKIGEALEEFKIEVAANPDEFLGNYYLGVVYNFQRQWALAITFLPSRRSCVMFSAIFRLKLPCESVVVSLVPA